MKKQYNRGNILHIGFYVGLIIKAIDAMIEFLGGLVLAFFNHELLNRLIRLIALPELREDPNDILMNYFITLGQNFSITSQHSVAIYMILHGVTKIGVVWLLLAKKLWAFPLAISIFGIFVSIETYSYIRNPSILLLLFIIIDIAMIGVIILEYKRLKVQKNVRGVQ